MSDGQNLLPADFSDLERFAAKWALPDINARYEQRKASTMAELQDFYDTLVPRAEAAISYLDDFDLHDMPDDAQRLLWMLAALSGVGFAVDVFKQPTVPDSNDSLLPWVVAPWP